MNAMTSQKKTANRKLFLYTGVLAFLISLWGFCGHGVQAQGLPATLQKGGDQPGNLPDQVKSLSERVDTITKDLKKLEAESKQKPKDFWDKLSALSGWFTGGFVVLIGTLATYIYNKRSNKAAQVQAISSLITHLQSTARHEREAALLAISALGDPGLAARFADLYRDEGSIAALKRMEAYGEDKAKREANKILMKIPENLKSKVAI